MMTSHQWDHKEHNVKPPYISHTLAGNKLLITQIHWSIACWHCFNYIFILDLTSGFNGLGRDNCKGHIEELGLCKTYTRSLMVCLRKAVYNSHTILLKKLYLYNVSYFLRGWRVTILTVNTWIFVFFMSSYFHILFTVNVIFLFETGLIQWIYNQHCDFLYQQWRKDQ